jgi:nitrite reductase/ring-hydroxylating ferredoxin subunit
LVLSIFIAQEPQMADFVKVANTNEIEPGQARLVDVKGKQIALFNVDGQFFALDNTCTHRGGPLAEGEVLGHEVTCPWHGATFDVRTGEVVGPPAERAVVRYGVRVTETDIEVEL